MLLLMGMLVGPVRHPRKSTVADILINIKFRVLVFNLFHDRGRLEKVFLLRLPNTTHRS